MNQQEKRIKLAEAMGRDPAMYAPNFDIPIFDPFTNPTDDYAVLEWMRKKYDTLSTTPGSAIKHLVYVRFREELYQLNGGYCDGYKIGNNARAALKVIEND